MSNVLRILFSFYLLSLFYSCSTEIGVVNVDEEIEEESLTGAVLTIGYTTLESINDELSEIDVEIFTESELTDLRISRTEKACLNAKYKGDVNGDDLLEIEDILVLFSAIIEYDDTTKYPDSANGDGRLDINQEYHGNDPDFWTMVHISRLTSFDESGQPVSLLERADMAVIVDLLTGYCD